MLENILGNPLDYRYSVAEYFNGYFLTNIRVIDLIVVFFAAALCAISGFSYLHSKTQLDTYHSMPVGRLKLFASRYVSGVLVFFVPYVVHMLICLAIAGSRGAYESGSVGKFLQCIVARLAVFMVVYAASIVAVCLTGNIVISMIAVVVFFCYSSVLSLLVSELLSHFMLTFTSYGYKGAWAFSPLDMVIKLYTGASDNGSLLSTNSANCNIGYLPAVIAGTAVYTVIGALLYKRRACESAGKAIAFKWAEPVVKTACVIPVAFFSGIFFDSLISTSDSADNWYIFGLVFGYVIVALVLEVIFRMDIKGIFEHKKQFVFNAVCTVLIFVVFKYDILGYNTYVPDDSELQSCSVDLYVVNDASIYGRFTNGDGFNIDDTDYCMERMELKGNPSVTELARRIAVGSYNEDEEANYKPIIFGYNFTNGKKVYRRYYVNIKDEETMRLIADVFDDTDYKAASLPMLDEELKVDYGIVSCVGKFNSDTLALTPKLSAELLEAYRTDYQGLSFETVLNTYPIGAISLTKPYDDEASSKFGYVSTSELVIYPEYTNTINWLKENGFDINFILTAEDVSSITATHYTDRDWEYGSYSSSYEDIEITDPEQISEILENIITNDWRWLVDQYTDFFDDYDDYYLLYIDTYENFGCDFTYYFVKGYVPSFLEQ
jgi:hypothetical protein